MIRKTLSIMAQILLLVGVAGMWASLGNAIWLFFVIISIGAIIVVFVTEG